MGSCFPFLSGEDNAHELALLFPIEVLTHTNTHTKAHENTQSQTQKENSHT